MKDLLYVENISKSFPGVMALKNVSLNVEKGEVLALLGENGAGKSTLMKVLSGVYSKETGTIEFNGEKIEIINPLHAKRLGISIIHQELNVMENLSVAENIFVGTEMRKNRIFVDKKEQVKRTKELLSMVGLDVDPNTLVKHLPIASRQMVEIAKSLSINAKLIIMDEPTSSLTEHETEKLFQIVRNVCVKGISIIYISHRLEEIFEIAHRVTVLRDGQTIGTRKIGECTKQSLVSMMVGREIDQLYPKTKNDIGEEILRVHNISTSDLLKNISFSISRGEVLGFSGLVGAGRTELARVIFGLDKKTSGDVFFEGRKVNVVSPWDAIRLGIGYLPEDRKREGLIQGMTVRSNISLAWLMKVAKKPFINRKHEKELAKKYIEKLRIKTPSDTQIVKNLSGGNQQKVVLSKWLSTMPKVLILDEPTRGVDVAAKKEIHSMIDQLAKTGMAIVVISSEMSEVLGVSDRIVVMHDGEIKCELSRDEATQEKILNKAILQESSLCGETT